MPKNCEIPKQTAEASNSLRLGVLQNMVRPLITEKQKNNSHKALLEIKSLKLSTKVNFFSQSFKNIGLSKYKFFY